MNTPRQQAFGRRAAIRKTGIEEDQEAASHDPDPVLRAGAETAGLIFTGVPEEAPLSAADAIGADHANWIVTHLRPIMSDDAWEKFTQVLTKAGRTVLPRSVGR